MSSSADGAGTPVRAENAAMTASTRHILFASLIGTTIEFFDFYIYATAAVLVFPTLFFPVGDAASATLQSLATFALAFFARPVGSALFGHFGDRVGRKATLVAALMTMGLSTVLIGLLPTYATIGVAAPLLLALCRLGQGIGLGGEWGGAVLLATENAPPHRRAWYGMFPQLGAPLGFLCSTGIFLFLSRQLNDADFFAWGWRIPFLASALLVAVGLYVRLKLTETPAFLAALRKQERVRVPIVRVFARHNPDSGWVPTRDSEWKDLRSVPNARYSLAVARNGACMGNAPNGPAVQIVRDLRAPVDRRFERGGVNR